MTGASQDIAAVAARLTPEALNDIRNGNCIMAGETCVCGSNCKGELAEHRLADFPENLDAGCLLNRRGLALRNHLIESDQ